MQTSFYVDSDMQMIHSLTHLVVDTALISCLNLAWAGNHIGVVTMHKMTERPHYSLY